MPNVAGAQLDAACTEPVPRCSATIPSTVVLPTDSPFIGRPPACQAPADSDRYTPRPLVGPAKDAHDRDEHVQINRPNRSTTHSRIRIRILQ